MNSCFLAGLVAASMLLPTPAVAQGSFSPPYTVETLKNGLDVIVLESHKVPLITIVLAAKAGGMTETPETNGLTHLWEHMFFKGNKRLANQEAFNRRVRQLGISFNGDTSAEKVRYFFSMPSTFLEEGLQFMADAIATPLLEKKELEKERKVVLDEYDRAASHPSFDLRRLKKRIIYGKLDYLRDPLGDAQVIRSATQEQLRQIKKEVFVPKNSALLIAGDFDSKKIHALVKKYFLSWKNPKDWKPIDPPDFPSFPKTIDVVMTREQARNVEITYTFEGPKARLQPSDSFAADILLSLLGLRSGNFYKKFIDSGLTYDAGVSYYTQSQAGEVHLYAQTSPENANKVKSMLLEETKLWQKDDYFTKDQLEDVRRNLLINYKRELNKPSAYIKSLAFWWAVTGLDYYKSYLPNLSKTTLKDVQAFVKKYLIEKPYIATTLLSPADAKKAKLKDNASKLMKKYKLEAAGA